MPTLPAPYKTGINSFNPPTKSGASNNQQEWTDTSGAVVTYVNSAGVLYPLAAPAGAQYVVLSAHAALSGERVLTAGSNITLTDNGAGSTLVIAATGGGGGGNSYFPSGW